MSIYAIGDLQGCYDELQDLLHEINFDENKDQLWFTGDLVNRGPKSLECLQFVIQLGNKARTVLGNHDLHLLAVANGVRKPHRKDTFDEILNHPERERLLSWIRQQPMIIADDSEDYSMVHAGLYPDWTIKQALDLSKEVEDCLQGKQYEQFIQVIYGNEPAAWSDKLQGFDRIRCLINGFTRMRFLDEKACMNYDEKASPGRQAEHLIPWYEYPERRSEHDNIIFGHWSTIYCGVENDFSQYNVYPLDTGCLWGGKLTALRLNSQQWFEVPSRQSAIV
ncbi:MAG: symmetrical bis(5'-nucleosyl)-tetraphosphatase [Thiotrichales bacterium]|nr:symmetrical bis(5'-nucleosyl)-tetraphosphatase [Thiotrichales bacterium]